MDFESPTSSRESATTSAPTPTSTDARVVADAKPKRKPRAPKPKTIPWDWELGFLELGREPETLPSRMKKYENAEVIFPGESMTTENTLNTEIASAKGGALTLAQRPVGFEDFQLRDLIVPDLKVGQGQSRVTDAEVAGKLYSSIDHTERHDKMRVVFLAFRHGQVMFAKKGDGKPDFEAPTPCRSNDGKFPAKDIEAPISQQCRDEFGEPVCSAAKWTDKKPACAETYNLVIVDVNTGMPYRFSMKGESVTTAKRLLSSLLFRADKNKLSIYDFEADLGLTKLTGNDGAYYAPVFGNIAAVEAGKYKGLFEQFARARGADEVEQPKKSEATGTVAEAAAKAEAEKKSKPKSRGGKDLDFDT